MSKQETQILKGVAILLMLFLHLFNREANVALCYTFINIGDVPLISYLVRAANPVSFFLILGGYGMYKVWKKGDKNRFGRIWKLLMHYWVILILFVSVGTIFYPNSYPGSALTILLNFLTVNTSYNGECWFLFPYIVLSLLSPYLFKLCDKFRVRWVLLFFLFVGFGTSFIISRYGNEYLYNNLWIYDPFLVIHIAFPFVLGAMAAKCDVFRWQINIKPVWALVLLLLLICIRCLFRTSAFHTIYVFLFIFLFLKLKRSLLCDKILAFLGGGKYGYVADT